MWEFAETRFQEYKSSELLCDVLQKEGFTITKAVANIDTAFVATFGSGKPKIGILGEFDALYNLSQKSDTDVKEAIIQNGNGHGCGHNALGAGALAAVVAVKDYMIKNNIKGTICYFGCPGEEGGSGKAYMAREKVFNDVDAAFTWHPADVTGVVEGSSLANIQAYVRFYGKSAHAAACPHLGRSALDAVELMNVGINYLREHVIEDARMHYALTNGGGLSPNVVQAFAEELLLVRAPKMSQTKEIYERVKNIAKGAALMTDTKVEIIFDKAASNVVVNDTLSKVMYEKLLELGQIKLTKKEEEFAKKIKNTLSDEEKITDKVMMDSIKEYKFTEKAAPESTDVGDVSFVVPTAQINTSCWVLGTAGHSWQVVAQGKCGYLHNAMILAGKVMALSALELFENNEIIVKAKEELKERLNGEEYICPIPSYIKPHLTVK
ncbi:M20 family metallopeptidase [Clostridium guangxiense]|uniref:M20 family metallopeptidase n=1 Tax=Clostridium guangxiense TaxID=1662055 RepID=UPI001E297046|nr:M20 family metallopeptidase [Clostridium guangxiense]